MAWRAGLSGHSDGDAVVHAIVDAILQAAGLGDLGTHFGTSRPEFAGAKSRVFLEHTLGLLEETSLQVSSVAVQIVANAPKIGPRREEAEANAVRLGGGSGVDIGDHERWVGIYRARRRSPRHCHSRSSSHLAGISLLE